MERSKTFGKSRAFGKSKIFRKDLRIMTDRAN